MNGNIITKDIVISNIDKVAPVIYGVVEDIIYSKEVSITVRDDLSGISKILIEKDGESKEYSIGKDIELSENGKYKITVQDNSGNITTKQFEININDESGNIGVDDKEVFNDYVEPDDEGTLPNEEDGGEYVEDEQVDTKVISNNDTTTAKMILPNTGEKNVLIFVAIFMIISTIMYIKLKKYKDVK